MLYKILNIHEVNTDDIIHQISEERLKKASASKQEETFLRSVCVEYLLNSMAKELFMNRSDKSFSLSFPLKLTYDSHQKPHILSPGGDDLFFFSLSHSGDYVACVISDKPCGIDIEQHKNKPYHKLIPKICTEKEALEIHSIEDFYHFWTTKESLSKAIGLGLSLDFRQIEITDRLCQYKGNQYQCTPVSAPDGYSLSICELL